MNDDLIKKIVEVSMDSGAEDKIEQLLEEGLSYEPKNIELWLRLAILESSPPIVDCDKSISCLQTIFNLDPNNISALLIFAYIHYYQLGGIDQVLFNKLISFHAPSNELGSMLRYAASWFYADRNIKLEKKLLEESIELYKYHVWNYVDLAKIFSSEGKKQKAEILIDKGLTNVVKKYPVGPYNQPYDITDIEEFINEHIKGIYLTNTNYERIQKLKETGLEK
jgi:hypothetical protein